MALTFVLLEAAKVWLHMACLSLICCTALVIVQANLALWEFTGSLADISLPEATRRTMAEFYIANASRIRTVLTSVVSGTAAATAAASEAGLGAGAAVVAPAASPASIVLGLPAYRGLEWRLAVSLGSRLQPNTIVPSLTLRLDTSASTAGRDNAVVTQAHPSGDASAAVTTASVLDKGAAPVASVYFQADAAALAAAIASLEQAQAEVKTANMRRMMRYLH